MFTITFIKELISNNTELLSIIMPDSYEVVTSMIMHFDQYNAPQSSYEDEVHAERECKWALKQMQVDVQLLVDTVEHDKKCPILG